MPLYANNATSTLTQNMNVDDSELYIQPADVPKFPSTNIPGQEQLGYFVATLCLPGLPDLYEIVHVSYAREMDGRCVVTRGEEGTEPYPWPMSSKFECRVTAGILGGFLSKEALDGFLPTGDARHGGLALADGSAADHDGIAIGENSVAMEGGVALGRNALAQSGGSNAIGLYAASAGSNSTAIGSTHFADHSWSAYGVGVVGRGPHNGMTGNPSYINYDGLAGVESLLCTNTVELGIPARLVFGQACTDGDVLRPEAAQQPSTEDYYYRMTRSLNAMYEGTRAQNWEGAYWPSFTEPKFAMVLPIDTPYYPQSPGTWNWTDDVCIEMVGKNQAVIQVPGSVVCFPSEISFIGFKLGAVTSQPVVTVVGVGMDGSTRTTLVEAVSLAQVTAPYMRQRFTLAAQDMGLSAIEISWTSADASLLGRFCVRGAFFTQWE